MPLSDLDEFTGRTTDGISRGARFLSTFDAIKDAIGSGDRDRERAGFEHARSIWSDMTEKERREVAHLMSAKFLELSEAYARSVVRNLGSEIEHFRRTLVGEQKTPAEIQTEAWADATVERLRNLHRSRAKEPKAPAETQATISAWAEATFGPSGSNARAIARANREMAELLEHVTADDRHPEAAEEIADIVIVLSRVMTRLGVDLQAAIDRKMAKNRARKWRLDGTGHGYHVEEEAVSARPRNPCCGNTGTHGEGDREYCSTCGQEIPR